jgi:steroid delta-isomerase-like uncharacterized protein
MSEENKAVVREFFQRVNERDLSVVDDMVDDGFIEHEELPGLPQNKDGARQFFTMAFAAFPDFRLDPESMVAEGDMVVVRGKMSGTHLFDFMGIPTTGKQVSVSFFDEMRVANGKIVEHWGLTDSMTMMQQLGVGGPPA